MSGSNGRTLVIFVVIMAILQVLFEDVLLFLDTTSTGVPVPLVSPLLFVGVPLVFSVLLFGVLFLAALRSSNVR